MDKGIREIIEEIYSNNI